MANVVTSLLQKMSTDENTGRYSGHRVWYSISNMVATGAVIKMIVLSQLNVDFFIAYMGIVGGYSVAVEMIRTRFADGTMSLLSQPVPPQDQGTAPAGDTPVNDSTDDTAASKDLKPTVKLGGKKV